MQFDFSFIKIPVSSSRNVYTLEKCNVDEVLVVAAATSLAYNKRFKGSVHGMGKDKCKRKTNETVERIF
jgi:hypothetical protein